MSPSAPLLSGADPNPVAVFGEGGRPDVLLVGDHAGNAIPTRLETLGLRAPDLVRHIAWDVGVRALGEHVSALLDATFIHQSFSRLVIDCNRDPGSPQAILAHSDGSDVPGNAGVDAAAREERRVAIHEPYHQRVAEEVARRRRRPAGAGATAGPLVVALHSFVPIFGGQSRPWHVGVLHGGGDTGPSRAVLARLRAERDLAVGDNQPYAMDGTDYTVPRHAHAQGLPYLELEFRQDLLGDDAGVRRWAQRCAAWLEELLRTP